MLAVFLAVTVGIVVSGFAQQAEQSPMNHRRLCMMKGVIMHKTTSKKSDISLVPKGYD